MICFIVTFPYLFPTILHFPTLIQDLTPFLYYVNSLQLTLIDIHFLYAVSSSGILYHMTYSLYLIARHYEMFCEDMLIKWL